MSRWISECTGVVSSPFLFAHHELTQRKSDFLPGLRTICLMTNASQLYAEPSLILYIRTKFDLSNVVIVSPDAGGAKRYAAI
jgi:hypothetical protein